MALDIQQRSAQHGHRRGYTCYETETSRVILRADPTKNGGITPATLRKKRWQIDDLAKPLHNRPIDQITAAELLHLLKPIEQSGRRETTKKLRATISAIFRLAMVTMRAPADPSAALKDAPLPPKVKGRAAIIDEKEFGLLLRRIDKYKGWPVTCP